MLHKKINVVMGKPIKGLFSLAGMLTLSAYSCAQVLQLSIRLEHNFNALLYERGWRTLFP